MKASVRAAFVGFTSPLEGVCPFLYLDVLGLVTTAIGNLVDTSQGGDPQPWRPVLGLPFQHLDGRPATDEEIVAEWKAVKARQDMKMMGGGAFAKVTTLRLPPLGIEQVVNRKLEANDAILRQRFPDFEDWPADAQLATHSMAWACGANFHFPQLERALKERNFGEWTIDPKTGTTVVTGGAALHCHINTDGPDHVAGTADDFRGIIPRNNANQQMYVNAMRVMKYKLDPDEVNYPRWVFDLDQMPTPVDPITPNDMPIIHPDVPLDSPSLDDDGNDNSSGT